MKRFGILSALASFSMLAGGLSAPAWGQDLAASSTSRPKVGLVLAGGGARGSTTGSSRASSSVATCCAGCSRPPDHE